MIHRRKENQPTKFSCITKEGSHWVHCRCVLSRQSKVSQHFPKEEKWSAVHEEHHKILRKKIHIIMGLICQIVASFSFIKIIAFNGGRGMKTHHKASIIKILMLAVSHMITYDVKCVIYIGKTTKNYYYYNHATLQFLSALRSILVSITAIGCKIKRGVKRSTSLPAAAGSFVFFISKLLNHTLPAQHQKADTQSQR